MIFYKKLNKWQEILLEMNKKLLHQHLEKLFVIMVKDNLDINMIILIIQHK